MDEQPLSGGMVNEVTRIGDTVRRNPERWTPAVLRLLRHLEEVGFDGAPRVLGFDEKGREILSWIEGTPANRPWPPELRSEEGLVAMGGLLRRFHVAVEGYTPPRDAEWCIGRKPIGDGEIVCHGDLGPWNIIWRDGRPVAFIDWDFAEPASAVMDVGHMAFYSIPLRDDGHCLECGFNEVPNRYRRLEALAEGYGMGDLPGIVDAAEHYLRENIRRMQEFGPRGIKPWAGFVDRGFLKEDRDRLGWLKENRELLLHSGERRYRE